MTESMEAGRFVAESAHEWMPDMLSTPHGNSAEKRSQPGGKPRLVRATVRWRECVDRQREAGEPLGAFAGWKVCGTWHRSGERRGVGSTVH